MADPSGLDLAQAYQILRQAADKRDWMPYTPQGPMLPAMAGAIPQHPQSAPDMLGALALRPQDASWSAPETQPGLLPYAQPRVPPMSPEAQTEALDILTRKLVTPAAIGAAGAFIGMPEAGAMDALVQMLPESLQQYGALGAMAAGVGRRTPWATAKEGTPEWLQQYTQTMADAQWRNAFGSQQSTRLPSTVDAPEDPHSQLLTTGYDSWSRDPEMMRKNVEAMLQYPNFQDLHAPYKQGALSAPDAAEQIIGRIQDNLQWLHDSMDPEFRQRAKLWYDGANKIANRWSMRYGATPEQVAGTMAVTSPGTDWFINAERARRMLEFWQNRGTAQWTPEMDQIWNSKLSKAFPEDARDAIYDAIQGKSFQDVMSNPNTRAAWFRTYDEAMNSRQYNTLTPEGEYGPVASKKGDLPKDFNWSDFGQIRKAFSILENGSRQNISDNLGGEHKVRNFYNNIIDPDSSAGHVTIDTHAVAASLMRALAQKSLEVGHNFGGTGSSSSGDTGENGTYGLYAEAYRRAAAANGLLPREMQSITWEAIRSLFSRTFKGQAANVSGINQLWKDVSDGKMSIDDARKQAYKLGGGFDRPEWYTTGRWNPQVVE